MFVKNRDMLLSIIGVPTVIAAMFLAHLLNCMEVTNNMKKFMQILSGICCIIAVVALVAYVPTLFGSRNWFIQMSMFSTVRSGGTTGFLGNLLNVAIICIGFGEMGWNGFKASKGEDRKAIKTALIAGSAMTVLFIISLICSIAMHIFTFGDLLMVLFAAAYTGVVFAGIKTNG